jgi:hypothetical protein
MPIFSPGRPDVSNPIRQRSVGRIRIDDDVRLKVVGGLVIVLTAPDPPSVNVWVGGVRLVAAVAAPMGSCW